MYIPTMRILRYLLRKMRVFIFKWRIGAYHFVHFNKLLRHIFLFCYKESHIYVEMCVWLFGHQKNGLCWLISFFLSAPKPLLPISFYHSDTMNCISPSTPIVLFDSTTGCQRGLEKWGMEKELSFCLFVSPFWISPATSLYPDSEQSF